ncbi:MAG: hypothetical protein AAGG38_06850, partial [Planctomycetota bacterium]
MPGPFPLTLRLIRRLGVACATLLASVGCTTNAPPAATPPASTEPPAASPLIAAPDYPADFALVFFLDTPMTGETPRERRALHLVEPDRTLRSALGPGVGPDLYPPATATLTTAEMATLYRLAAAAVRFP